MEKYLDDQGLLNQAGSEKHTAVTAVQYTLSPQLIYLKVISDFC